MSSQWPASAMNQHASEPHRGMALESATTTMTATHHAPESSHGTRNDASLLFVAQATPAKNRRSTKRPPSLPGTILATADKSSGETDGGVLDSGYASLSGTPQSNTSGNTQDGIAGDIIQLPHRSLFRKKGPLLRQFDKEIPLETHQRFADLGELFGKPLHDYLAKAKPTYKSISMKLKVLGQSEDAARPWIIVQCDSPILKKVKQFFQQKWVKDEYQPKSPESNLLYFDILYLDRALKLYAVSAHPDVRHDPSAMFKTLCGVAVRVDNPCGPRNATLGGIISVVTLDGVQEFYGMTVGHVVTNGTPREDEAIVTEYSSEEEDEDGSTDEDGVNPDFEEGFQLEVGFEDDNDVNQAEPSSKGYAGPFKWPKLGHIHATSRQADEGNLDWALVTLDREPNHLPNVLMDSAGTHSLWNSKVLEIDKLASISRRAVVLVNDAEELRQGRLLPSASFVMLAPGRGFIRVYNMTLTTGTGFKPGDCGSWVADSETKEVYGHVVAADAFGDVYVVPIGAALRSIKKQLRAETVVLPTVDEWLKLRLDRLKSEAPEVISAPARETTTSSTETKESTIPIERSAGQPDNNPNILPKRMNRKTGMKSRISAMLTGRRQRSSSATQHNSTTAPSVVSKIREKLLDSRQKRTGPCESCDHTPAAPYYTMVPEPFDSTMAENYVYLPPRPDSSEDSGYGSMNNTPPRPLAPLTPRSKAERDQTFR